MFKQRIMKIAILALSVLTNFGFLLATLKIRETMKGIIGFLTIILLCSVPVSSLNAQNSATEGKEFYFNLMDNQYDPTLYVRYVVSQTCRITAQYGDGTYLDNNVQYTPGTYTKQVDKNKIYTASTSSVVTNNKYMKVTATEDIGLYAINLQSVSTDAATIIPVKSLGNHYTVISNDSYPNSVRNSYISVIAPTSGTVITIKDPSGTVVASNVSVSVGTVYIHPFLGIQLDLTGYTVESNHNICVFSAVSCGNTHPDGGCDHNYEQMMPTNTAGKHYFVWSMSQTTTDYIKVVALEDGTNVTLKHGLSNTYIVLNKHQIHAFNTPVAGINATYVNNTSGVVEIISDKPVIVDHIAGYGPSVTWIAPIEQRITKAYVSPFVPTTNPITSHWLHLIIPSNAENTMQVKETRSGVETNVVLPFFTNTTNSDYKIAYKQYSASDDVLIDLENPSGFTAYITGQGTSVSYIITAGAGAYNLQNYFTIQEKASTIHTYYENTTEMTHTFVPSDYIEVKRTLETSFTSVTWLINGSQYTISENTNITNTLYFPASALQQGENFLTMSVRYSGALADSLYSGSVWLSDPCSFPDWIRLDSAINKHNAPVITIYRASSGVVEDLPNGIMTLCHEEDFINSNGMPINVSRPVTVKSVNTTDSIITLYTPGLINDSKRHFIVLSGGHLTVENMILDGSIQGSTATGTYTPVGGGIAATDSVTLRNTTVQYCYTEANGGGIQASNALTLEDTVIIVGNISGYNGSGSFHLGGGIYKGSTGDFITSGLDSLLVSGNTAHDGIGGGYSGSSGGGMAVMGVDVTFLAENHVTISENTASYGGGIVSIGATLALYDNVKIIDNTAVLEGGGIYMLDHTDLKADMGVVFSGNTAVAAHDLDIENPAYIYDPDAFFVLLSIPGVPITVNNLKTLHGTNIQTTTFSVPSNSYLYNNYDVNFVGDPIKAAADDTVQVLTCYNSTVLDVLANDNMIPCNRNSLVFTITSGSKVGAITAVDSNKDIVYTRAANFTGHDTLEYQVECAGTIYEGTVFMTVVECPDNIDDADCVGTPEAFAWGIRTSWSSPETLSSMSMPFVGDLDGDGIPEIVCFSYLNRTSISSLVPALVTVAGNAPAVNTLVIYDGLTKTVKKQFSLPSYVSEYDAPAYGLIKTADGTGLIVVATIDLKMRAYDINGNLIWTTRTGEDYGSAPVDLATTVSFADFNGDGHPEVYIRDKIYYAETGFLLGTASGGFNQGLSWGDWTQLKVWKQSVPFAADVTGNGRLNLILGNEIYDVQITDRNSTSNPITRVKTITPPAGVPADGHAQVADFNKDGHLDILITNRNISASSGGTVYMYIWDVHNNTVSNAQAIATSMSGKSIPLIADIDNDGELEILIQCAASDGYFYRCYKYDATTRSFSYLWGFAPSEDSYSTTATLFDFNHDGMNEILLADQARVRILNGSGKSHITGADTLAVYTMAEMAFGYGTCMQYPIIADVDGDGSADLIAIGMPGATSPGTQNGSLNIFKSSTAMNWAPARRVWNQYMYNAVHVNDDLTTPHYQMNPATVFPGEYGLYDVRPYNNFLQQQTMLNQFGNRLWSLPDVTPVLSESLVSMTGNTMNISLRITNLGDAAIGSPVHIAM